MRETLRVLNLIDIWFFAEMMVQTAVHKYGRYHGKCQKLDSVISHHSMHSRIILYLFYWCSYDAFNDMKSWKARESMNHFSISIMDVYGLNYMRLYVRFVNRWTVARCYLIRTFYFDEYVHETLYALRIGCDIIDIWYMIWYDLIWYDIWYDTIWYEMIYEMVWYGMVRYGMVWYVMVLYDMIWYDIGYDIWYDVIWYAMIWYDMIYDMQHNITWVLFVHTLECFV